MLSQNTTLGIQQATFFYLQSFSTSLFSYWSPNPYQAKFPGSPSCLQLTENCAVRLYMKSGSTVFVSLSWSWLLERHHVIVLRNLKTNMLETFDLVRRHSDLWSQPSCRLMDRISAEWKRKWSWKEIKRLPSMHTSKRRQWYLPTTQLQRTSKKMESIYSGVGWEEKDSWELLSRSSSNHAL